MLYKFPKLFGDHECALLHSKLVHRGWRSLGLTPHSKRLLLSSCRGWGGAKDKGIELTEEEKEQVKKVLKAILLEARGERLSNGGKKKKEEEKPQQPWSMVRASCAYERVLRDVRVSNPLPLGLVASTRRRPRRGWWRRLPWSRLPPALPPLRRPQRPTS